MLDRALVLAPGVCAAAAVMGGSFLAADSLGHALMSLQSVSDVSGSPVSGVPVAIIAGLALNNLFNLPKTLQPGLKFCVTTVLRAGIVCVGLKLSVFDMVKLGVVGVPMVATSIGAGLLVVRSLSNRVGLPPRLGSLIAAGTSICGVTAVVSLAPVIKATDQEVAYAVANVVAFGLIGMLCYPYLAHSLLPTSEQVGLFLGTAIHDTSQVMGAALSYKEMFMDEVVLKVAAVTKLTRNLFLAAVIPALGWVQARQDGGAGSSSSLPMSALFPSFVMGFVAMAVVRSTGDYWVLQGATDAANSALVSPEQWKHVTSFVGGSLSKVLLGTAMAAVGLNTSLSVLRGVGPLPFAVGFAAALFVGIVGFTMAYTLGAYVSFEGA